MRRMSEGELAAYLDERDRRQNSRLLADRYFQGTVTAVSGAGPYTVQIQRVGETQPDGNTYVCAVPGYIPLLGDVVELAWRDAHTAHVDHPLGTAFQNTGSGKFATAIYQGGSWIAGGPYSTTSLTQLVPAPYKAIEVIWQANGTLDSNLFIRINQDSGANYYGNRWVMSGNVGSGFQDSGATSNSVGLLPASGTFGSGRILIHSRSDSHGIGWEAASQANFYAGTTGSLTAGGTYAGSGALQYITLLITAGVWNAADFEFYGYV
jgi:hypothetical protein